MPLRRPGSHIADSSRIRDVEIDPDADTIPRDRNRSTSKICRPDWSGPDSVIAGALRRRDKSGPDFVTLLNTRPTRVRRGQHRP